MDLLFRLKKDINAFKTETQAKDFFKNTIKSRDNNYFFHTKKIRQSQKGDIIYFAFEGYIIAKAIYGGNIIINQIRDKDFINGHELNDIFIIDGSLKINSNIIKGRGIKYIDENSIEKEIEKVLTRAKFTSQ